LGEKKGVRCLKGEIKIRVELWARSAEEKIPPFLERMG